MSSQAQRENRFGRGPPLEHSYFGPLCVSQPPPPQKCNNKHEVSLGYSPPQITIVRGEDFESTWIDLVGFRQGGRVQRDGIRAGCFAVSKHENHHPSKTKWTMAGNAPYHLSSPTMHTCTTCVLERVPKRAVWNLAAWSAAARPAKGQWFLSAHRPQNSNLVEWNS